MRIRFSLALAVWLGGLCPLSAHTVAADHDGLDILGYRCYLDTHLETELPATALLSGVVVCPIPDLADGEHSVAIGAFTAVGEAISLPVFFTAPLDAPPPTPPPQAVDCVVSAWSVWAEVQQGVEMRTRTVVTPAANGGAACPALQEFRQVAPPPPPPPPDPSPAGPTGLAVRPQIIVPLTLTWNAVPGAVGYEVQVLSSGNTIVLQAIRVLTTSLGLPLGQPAGNYTWRVRACGPPVNGASVLPTETVCANGALASAWASGSFAR